MSKDHGHRFAVYSPTGVHIGLWTDGKIASEVQSESPGNTLEELVTLDLAQAMVAAAYLDAANLHQSLWRETSAYKTDQILKRTPADARAALDAMLSQASAEGFDRGVKEAQPIVESLRAELKALYDIIGYDMLDLESTPVAALDALLAKAREDALREAAEICAQTPNVTGRLLGTCILDLIERTAGDGA